MQSLVPGPHRGPSWRPRLGALLALATLGPSCSAPPTRVLLVVDAQPRIRAMARSLRLTAFGLQRIESTDLRPTQTEQQSWPAAGRPLVFPVSFLLTQEQFPRYEVHVEALDAAGARLAIQGVRGSFVHGETRLVRLVLVDGCLGVDCDDPSQVCGCPDGSLPALNCERPPACVPPREVGGGDDYDPAEVYACEGGPDTCRLAQQRRGAGVEAGRTDAGGGTEGGRDAAPEASPEAAVDSGPEGGTDAAAEAAVDSGPEGGMDAAAEAATDASMPPAPGCATAPMDGVPCLPGPSGCSGDVTMGRAMLPGCPDDAPDDCQAPVCSAAPGTLVPRPANSNCATGSSTGTCTAMGRCASTAPTGEIGTWPPTMCSTCAPPPPHGPRFGTAVALAMHGRVLAASEPDAPTVGGHQPMGRVLLVAPSTPSFTSLTWNASTVRPLGPADAVSTVTPTTGRGPDTSRPMAFGAALAMLRHGGETWLAVGAPLTAATGSAEASGAVFVYRWPGTDRDPLPPSAARPLAVLWPPEPHTGQAFGRALALRATPAGRLRLLVGAPETHGGASHGPGAAFLYEWDATAARWQLVLRWQGAPDGERFGEAVALDAQRAYAAGYVHSGEAALGVAATDGRGSWHLERLQEAPPTSGLCLAPSRTGGRPRLRLDADLGVVALLLATDEQRLDDDPAVEEKGRLGLFERTGTGGSWLGPVVFHTANASFYFRGLQAKAFDDVAVARGLVLVAGWLTDVRGGRPGAVALVRSDGVPERWGVADAGVNYGIDPSYIGLPDGLRARSVAMEPSADTMFPAVFGLFGDTAPPPGGGMPPVGVLAAVRMLGGA